LTFDNVYKDKKRAEAYAKLEFPGTYYLAYRDLPDIISKHVNGNKAVDFGCGTGRSTRYLKKLGYNTIGVDISEDMLDLACNNDPNGDYILVKDGDLSQFEDKKYDLVQSVFTFDNIPTVDKKIKNLIEIRRILKPTGKIIKLVSSPEIYTHEWASFTTKDFPENKKAKSGDEVRIIMTDVDDRRPVIDVVWSHESYQDLYNSAGLEIEKIYRPLAQESEPFEWVNETKIPPWVIYVLKTKSPKEL
jgi:ubiquinone/menaquinone biosynthesis C-methylase UbiE